MYFLDRKIAEKETVNNRFDFQLLFLMVSVISFRSAYAIFSVLVINEIFISDTAIEWLRFFLYNKVYKKLERIMIVLILTYIIHDLF